MTRRERAELTPEQRSLRSRIASHAKWANTPDRAAATAPARDNSPASTGYWERKVDPEEKLPPDVRKKLAANAKSEHYQRLAFASSRARGKRKTGTTRKAA